MQLVMDRWQRLVVFRLMPALMVGAVVVVLLLTWGDVPDPLATRFHPDGHATGTTPRLLSAVIQTVLVLGTASVLVRIGRRPTPDAPFMAAMAAFIGAFTTTLWASIAFANEGVADWHDVTLGDGALVGAIGGSIAWTVPIVLMARRIAPSRPTYANRAMPFGPDEHAAWFGHARSLGFAVAGGTMAVVGLAVAVLSQLWVGLLLIGIAVVLAGFTSVDVTIDERGISVRSGGLGWPRVRLPLTIVEEAEAIHVRPSAWGGWGYRGSLRLFKRAAWVLRSGEGVQLQLRGGQRFVVTIDDADEAAAVLNGLLARRAATPRSG